MKKRTKSLIVLLAFILIGLLGAGCATAGLSDKSSPPREPSPSIGGDYGEDFWYDEEASLVNPAPDKSGALLPEGEIERKYIQNGVLALRSSDIQKTYESLKALALDLGGRLVSYEQLSSGDVQWITMRVAVPFGKLNEFMEHTGDHVTKTETKTVTSEEVTESFYDTQTRIKSTEELIAHYRSLLTKAETIEDTLLVQSRIDDLTRELESLKGRMQVLQNLTGESRVDITIRMETDPTVTKPDVTWKTLKWSDVGYLMKSAIQKVGIGLILAVQYFLVFLVYATPLLVVAILTLSIIWLVRRKRRKKAGQVKTRIMEQPPED